VVKRRSKVIALVMMAGGYVILWLFVPQVPVWLKITVGVVLVTVGAWLASRPESVPVPPEESL
jgi:uncharacterized membrane protein YbaN (DUF454 family)